MCLRTIEILNHDPLIQIIIILNTICINIFLRLFLVLDEHTEVHLPLLLRTHLKWIKRMLVYLFRISNTYKHVIMQYGALLRLLSCLLVWSFFLLCLLLWLLNIICRFLLRSKGISILAIWFSHGHQILKWRWFKTWVLVTTYQLALDLFLDGLQTIHLLIWLHKWCHILHCFHFRDIYLNFW